MPGELRADVLRAPHRARGVRVRSGPRAPVRERVQELLRPVPGPEVQGRVVAQDQEGALGEGEGQAIASCKKKKK